MMLENILGAEDIGTALQIGGKYSSLSQLYGFTTENLAGYMPSLDFKEKNVLTVLGSGDQVINAYMLGAKKVSSFDINELAVYYADLKMSAIRHLDFDEFRSFLFRGKDSLRKNRYDLMKTDLDYLTLQFFDGCYDRFGEGHAIRESDLFNNRYDYDWLKTKCNPYLSSESDYLKARGRLRQPELINRDVKGLVLDEKYDIIMLSNIGDYAERMFPGDYLKAYAEEIRGVLREHLAEEGIICISYLYDIENKHKRSDIDEPEKRREAFNYQGELVFESVIPKKLDAVMIGGTK